ncbi:hypothetical protein Q4R10_18150 [Morganella morganii]|uniref:hypothetical protein n=1 Tax=Morganella morganii TaxID=582 RepID=UPI0031A765C8
MKFPKPNVYELYVKPNGKKSTFTITNTAGSNKFEQEDIARGAKIYMLVSKDTGGTVNYVGQTITSIQKRLYQGISHQIYRWSKQTNHYDLFVWNFSNLIGRSSSYSLDSIEAELALATRVNQGEWPIFQTSIKFRWFALSSFGSSAQAIAPVMIEQLYEHLLARGNISDHDIQLLKEQKSRAKYLLEAMMIGTQQPLTIST